MSGSGRSSSQPPEDSGFFSRMFGGGSSSQRSSSQPVKGVGVNHTGKVSTREDPFCVTSWPPIHNDPFLSHSLPEGKRAPKGQVTVVEDPLLMGVKTKPGTKGFMSDQYQLENDPFMTHNNPANNLREPSKDAKRKAEKEKKKKEAKYKPHKEVLKEDPFLTHGKAAHFEHLPTDPFMNYEYKKYSRYAEDWGNDPKRSYAPDGQLLCETDARLRRGPDGRLVPVSIAHANQQALVAGWYRAEPNRIEQAQLAFRHMTHLRRAVDDLQRRGQCPEGRWTNDPEIFPDMHLADPDLGPLAIVPYPPDARQFFVPGASEAVRAGKDRPDQGIMDSLATQFDDPNDSSSDSSGTEAMTISRRLKSLGRRRHPSSASTTTTSKRTQVGAWPDVPAWSRVTSLSPVQNCHADVFDYTQREATHLGRIYQGQLDNGYFIEALNAITLRPKLAKQMFYCYDAGRSIYIAQLYINGTWARVEVDDYVAPAFNFLHGADRFQGMICCRSEHFPHVLWPSLIEKAYAKVNTIRSVDPSKDSGGWQSLGGGGRVETALADLTGGVAGRFSTRDVSPDRLFLYLYELQRDVLFVCRPLAKRVAKFGVGFNPCVPHAVNRACPYEAQCYVQVFCGGPAVDDSGFQELTVPPGLVSMFPEKVQDGFYWMNIYDFHKFFETIIECRLVNSPDVGIVGMPPSRLPNATAPKIPLPMGIPEGSLFHEHTLFYEQVFATDATVTFENCPEFGVQVPGGGGPCEIVAAVCQTDKRALQDSTERIPDAPLLLKVYEQLGHNVYSSDMVMRSNWLPIRDSMVAFRCERGGTFRIVCEMPPEYKAQKLIFRFYTSLPGAVASASVALQRHRLAQPDVPPSAEPWSLVGCTREERLEYLSKPEPFNEEGDRMVPPELWQRQDCGMM
mmetsp:Transcript_31891/g.74598  ORF Transcript_31891/g.74598 Transcript_31891/m.74598 type:complete len:903 (-) Transcript_31891:106-2814(-)|eukprot:CAMPEP_0178414196 /NCGR_PEP_ID=MMETSP0689_2-20121128/22912_1 /TAXON_ID=160604 /ORGANISM="Amphidinium massartii, Strain CS-259" /LENGTH=902 /DNA_ID=CAMNT_0020035479 /DNA_START=173 /DNA_END=2881 /DNA_ORIENTATION=+